MIDEQTKTLLPHQERVKSEKREPDIKIQALEAFMGTPLYQTLEEPDRRLLRLQLVHMRNYSGVLGDRIEGFGYGA